MFASAKLAHFFYSAKFNGSFFAFFLLFLFVFLFDPFILCAFYDMEISWFIDGCGSSGAIGAPWKFFNEK